MISGMSWPTLEVPAPNTEPLTFFTIFIVRTSTMTHVSRMPNALSVVVALPAGVSITDVMDRLFPVTHVLRSVLTVGAPLRDARTSTIAPPASMTDFPCRAKSRAPFLQPGHPNSETWTSAYPFFASRRSLSMSTLATYGFVFEIASASTLT